MQGREAEARRVLCWLANSSEADAAEAVAAIAASARGERRVTWRGLLDARVVPRKLLLLTHRNHGYLVITPTRCRASCCCSRVRSA